MVLSIGSGISSSKRWFNLTGFLNAAIRKFMLFLERGWQFRRFWKRLHCGQGDSKLHFCSLSRLFKFYLYSSSSIVSILNKWTRYGNESKEAWRSWEKQKESWKITSKNWKSFFLRWWKNKKKFEQHVRSLLLQTNAKKSNHKTTTCELCDHCKISLIKINSEGT